MFVSLFGDFTVSFLAMPCPHLEVNLSRLSWVDLARAVCATCGQSGEVWLCLTCGFSGCGRLENGHMLKHRAAVGHSVAMNARTTLIWCYSCDNEVGEEGEEVRRKLVEKLVPKKKQEAGAVREGGRAVSSKPLKGCRGIVNLGNTCFLAAALQCLSHTFPLQKILRHAPPYSERELAGNSAQQRLVVALRNFFIQQWEESPNSGPVSPDDLLNSVQRLNSLFHGYQQHDSQEFLRFVLTTVHEELRGPQSRQARTGEGTATSGSGSTSKIAGGSSTPITPPSTTSIISSIFRGTTCSTITCLNCGRDSQCVEEFYDLSLPIPHSPLEDESRGADGIIDDASDVSDASQSSSNSRRRRVPSQSTGTWLWSRAKALLGLTAEPKVSLHDCLVQFTKSERLTGQNAYFCEHCKGKHECLKKISIDTLPEVLVVHLKRFRHDSAWGSKLSKVVTFPVATDLDVGKYMQKPSVKGKKKVHAKMHASSTSYRLTGFVQHMGSLGGGHYIAFNRHKSTGQWLCFDDSRVTLVPDLGSIEGAEPYVLFFQKSTTKAVIDERKRFKQARATTNEKNSFFLPRQWTSQLLSFSAVPPMADGLRLVCPHGRPSTTCNVHAQAQFERISDQYAKSISEEPKAIVQSLTPCELCKTKIDRYNFRLSLEHKLVTKLDTKNVEPGEFWFFIDALWVADWRQYLRHGAIFDINKACDPGVIANQTLADRLIKKDLKLKMTTDYIAVNKAVFDVFVHCHGFAGTEIKGPSLDILKATVQSQVQISIRSGSWELSDSDIANISHT